MNNLPETIDIHITKEDYENSSKFFLDKKNCPLAIAVKRILPHALFNGVGMRTIALNNYLDSYILKDGFSLINFSQLATGIEFKTQAHKNL